MTELFDQIERVWHAMKSGHAPLPMVAPIGYETRTEPAETDTWIKRDETYFTLRVNEMHLGTNRQWYSVYDPLVLVVVEFNHGNQRVTIPSVIGPNLIRKQSAGQIARYGTVLLDTCVTGPHPYRGGDIDISVSFYQVERKNYAKTLLSVVERLSNALGAVGQIAMMAKTGAALLEGVEGLLGLEKTVMLAGQRVSLGTSPLDPLKTGFYAMVTPPVPPLPNRLFVRDRRLYIRSGDEANEETRYGESDFVLLGISGSITRGDDSLFPFHRQKLDALMSLWDRTDGVELAKASLIAAYQQLRKSPDVTQREANALFDSWLTEFEAERERVKKMRSMPVAGSPHTVPAADTARMMSADIHNALRRIEQMSR